MISGLSHRLEAVERGDSGHQLSLRAETTSRDHSDDDTEVDSYEKQLKSAARQIAQDNGWMRKSPHCPIL
jgi:hypothetical protein